MNQAIGVPARLERICSLTDLVAGSGIAALVAGQQVALFYLPDTAQKVFAIGNFDPIGRANVLSRGIVSDVQGKTAVASPLYKQHFCLQTGVCIEQPEFSVPVYVVQVEDGVVSLCADAGQ